MGGTVWLRVLWECLFPRFGPWRLKICGCFIVTVDVEEFHPLVLWVMDGEDSRVCGLEARLCGSPPGGAVSETQITLFSLISECDSPTICFLSAGSHRERVLFFLKPLNFERKKKKEKKRETPGFWFSFPAAEAKRRARKLKNQTMCYVVSPVCTFSWKATSFSFSPSCLTTDFALSFSAKVEIALNSLACSRHIVYDESRKVCVPSSLLWSNMHPS